MIDYIQLLRPKDWAKNLFIFVPVFFAGLIFDNIVILRLIAGFTCFSLVASGIYIINDFRDIDADKIHPVKKYRPLATGKVNKHIALVISFLLVIFGFIGAWFVRDKFLFVLAIYFLLNIGYTFGLKKISILDIIIISIGFVLRVKAGATIAKIGLSEWLTIMVFLLALFLAFGKRRDDVLIKQSSGLSMRTAVKGYNLEFINTALAFLCAVIVVAYFMYTTSPEIIDRLKTYRLYYTCLFVLGGILRYLQLIYVHQDSESPTKILFRDRFIQSCIILWVISFYIILYVKNITIFK